MPDTFELDGRTYRWGGSQWIDAETFMSPPAVIVRRLDRRFGHLTGSAPVPSPTPKPKRKRKSTERIQDVVGPKVVRFIQQRFANTQDWVQRDEIRQGLLEDEKTHPYLTKRYGQTGQKMTFRAYVGNQIDHLSARITKEASQHTDQLERKKIDGVWAYRPAS
jgi:hypothetical protein